MHLGGKSIVAFGVEHGGGGAPRKEVEGVRWGKKKGYSWGENDLRQAGGHTKGEIREKPQGASPEKQNPSRVISKVLLIKYLFW